MSPMLWIAALLGGLIVAKKSSQRTARLPSRPPPPPSFPKSKPVTLAHPEIPVEPEGAVGPSAEDMIAINKADALFNDLVTSGTPEVVASAYALDLYDEEGGAYPEHIREGQEDIGASPTGVFDADTEERVHLIVEFYDALRQREEKEQDDSPDPSFPDEETEPQQSAPESTPQPSAKEDSDSISPQARKEAEKRAIEASDGARDQALKEGATIAEASAWALAAYAIEGGSNGNVIAALQQQMGMNPTGVFDDDTQERVQTLQGAFRARIKKKSTQPKPKPAPAPAPPSKQAKAPSSPAKNPALHDPKRRSIMDPAKAPRNPAAMAKAHDTFDKAWRTPGVDPNEEALETYRKHGGRNEDDEYEISRWDPDPA